MVICESHNVEERLIVNIGSAGAEGRARVAIGLSSIKHLVPMLLIKRVGPFIKSTAAYMALTNIPVVQTGEWESAKRDGNVDARMKDL